MSHKQESKFSHLEFSLGTEEIILQTPIFKVLRTPRTSAQGRVLHANLIQAPDWVNVIALTKNSQGENCFLMVRQFRHGSTKVILEFPGGNVDPGETDLQAAAARELLEETGFTAGSWTKLGDVNPNPAFMTNRLHTYLARDLRAVQKQSLDEHEVVDWEMVPVEYVRENLGRGEFDHGVILMSWWWYQKAGCPISL